MSAMMKYNINHHVRQTEMNYELRFIDYID